MTLYLTFVTVSFVRSWT